MQRRTFLASTAIAAIAGCAGAATDDGALELGEWHQGDRWSVRADRVEWISEIEHGETTSTVDGELAIATITLLNERDHSYPPWNVDVALARADELIEPSTTIAGVDDHRPDESGELPIVWLEKDGTYHGRLDGDESVESGAMRRVWFGCVLDERTPVSVTYSELDVELGSIRWSQ